MRVEHARIALAGGHELVAVGGDLSREAADALVNAANGDLAHGGGHRESELLGSAVVSALDLARELACASIALPVLSAGIYGYPPRQAVRVIVTTLRDWCSRDTRCAPREIRIVALDAVLTREIAQQLGEPSKPDRSSPGRNSTGSPPRRNTRAPD